MIVRALVEAAFAQLGIAGVSVTVVVALLLIATWAHKAAAAGSVVASAGSTAQHDLKIVAVLLLLMAVLGVVSINIERSLTLGEAIWNQILGVQWGAILP